MEIYDEYDISGIEVIKESHIIQEKLNKCKHADFSKISLNNDNELLEVWNLCSSATKVTFPEDFHREHSDRGFSIEAVRSICMNERVISINFEDFQLENIFCLLKDKTGLIEAGFDTMHATYEEIMNFINNNKSTLEDLELTLGYPDATLDQLDEILNSIKTNITSYCINIGYSRIQYEDEYEYKDIKRWCKERGGLIEWRYGTDDEALEMEFSS